MEASLEHLTCVCMSIILAKYTRTQFGFNIHILVIDLKGNIYKAKQSLHKHYTRKYQTAINDNFSVRHARHIKRHNLRYTMLLILADFHSDIKACRLWSKKKNIVQWELENLTMLPGFKLFSMLLQFLIQWKFSITFW